MSAQPDFDGDLLRGQLREDAFGRLLLGGRELWEHKRDFKATTTGNVAIEYRTSELPNGKGRVWDSGIATTKAGVYVIEYDEECRLVLPTERVRRLAALAVKDRESPAPRYRWCGDNNRFLNALVPVEWFVRPMRTTG